MESILTRSKQAAGTTDRERVCWLHDVIAAETAYGSSSASPSHDIRGAAGGTSVCEGIALWYSALATRLGIPNRVVLADCRSAARLSREWLPVLPKGRTIPEKKHRNTAPGIYSTVSSRFYNVFYKKVFTNEF